MEASKRALQLGLLVLLGAVFLIGSGAALAATHAGKGHSKPSRPLWTGGYESGDFSQWEQLDGSTDGNDFSLVKNPVTQGDYAFKSTVDSASVVPGEAGQRSMVLLFPENDASQNVTGAYEGSQRWYRNYIYFPRNFQPSPDTAWNWLVQWHNWPNGPCCSNLEVTVDTSGGGERLSLQVMGGGDEEHPVENNDIITEKNPAGHLDMFVGDNHLRRGHWYESVTHVNWSADPEKGRVQWWLDGHRVVSKKMSTLYWYGDNNSNYTGATPGPGQAYLMEGYYRPAVLPNGETDTSSATVLFDGAEISKQRISPGRVKRR
jgi:hypothetical protein